VPSVSHLAPTHLGLDVHKDTISVAILAPDHDSLEVDRIPHDEASIRRLVGRFPDPRTLQACYEAGPTATGAPRTAGSSPSGSTRSDTPTPHRWRARRPAQRGRSLMATRAGWERSSERAGRAVRRWRSGRWLRSPMPAASPRSTSCSTATSSHASAPTTRRRTHEPIRAVAGAALRFGRRPSADTPRPL
jgi:hypothetical protein